MEEEPESVDLAGLDILKLEVACKQKEYSKIHTREIEILEEVLFRHSSRQSLGWKENLEGDKETWAQNRFATDYYPQRNVGGLW